MQSSWEVSLCPLAIPPPILRQLTALVSVTIDSFALSTVSYNWNHAAFSSLTSLCIFMLKLFLVFVYIKVRVFLLPFSLCSSFETGSPVVDLVGPATQLCRPDNSHSLRSAYLYLWNSEIKGLCHQAWRMFHSFLLQSSIPLYG